MDLGDLLRENNFRRRSDAWTKMALGIFWTVFLTFPLTLLLGVIVWWLAKHLFWSKLSILSGLVTTIGAFVFIWKNAKPGEEVSGSWDNFIDMGPRGVAEGKLVLRTLTAEDDETIARGRAALVRVLEDGDPGDVPSWLEDVGVIAKDKQGTITITKRGEDILKPQEEA